MVYLIYASQTISIQNRIKKIIKESLDVVDDMNYVKFDGNNVLVQDYVDEANYVPLGYDHKVVVVDNCYYLIKPKARNKIESEQDYDKLIDFINHNDESVDLILTATSLSIDTKNEIYLLIKEKGKIVEIPDMDLSNWKEGVRKYCLENAKLKIDSLAINELAERTNGDLALLQNSVIKLSLYKDKITYDDVVLMVARPLEDNSFLFFNYLMQGKNIDAIGLLKDLKVNNVEPVTLIGMLANQFRLLNQIAYLSKQGESEDDIAKILKINPYRAKIMKKNMYYMSKKNIQKTLDDLYLLDLQIKSGLVDRYYGFELFLINFKRK